MRIVDKNIGIKIGIKIVSWMESKIVEDWI